MKIQGDRVRQARTSKGMTQGQLIDVIKRQGGKLSQGQLSAIENGAVARPGALVELADALGVSEDYLLGKAQDPQTTTEMFLSYAKLDPDFLKKLGDLVAKSGMAPGNLPDHLHLSPDAQITSADMDETEEKIASLPYRSEMKRDVPIYGTSRGGDLFGDFELNGQVVDFARRPPKLEGRKDVFAILVQGTSMAPWREPGDLVYVERNKPARPRDYVVIELLAGPDNVRPALIKRLIAVTPTMVKVEQFNPPKVIELNRAERKFRLYRVIDWTELMGI